MTTRLHISIYTTALNVFQFYRMFLSMPSLHFLCLKNIKPRSLSCPTHPPGNAANKPCCRDAFSGINTAIARFLLTLI